MQKSAQTKQLMYPNLFLL